jgi:hypothetical protein
MKETTHGSKAGNAGKLATVCLLVSLLCALSSCNKDAERAAATRDEMQTISSWAATARRVGEAWLGASLPTAYAQRTLQTVQQQLQEEMDTLSKSAHGSTEQGLKALEQARNLKTIVERMQALVGQADRAAMTRQLDQLSSQQQSFDALKESTDAQPK